MLRVVHDSGERESATALSTLRLRECPLLRAAVRLADPDVLAAAVRFHPASMCPAARRERAA